MIKKETISHVISNNEEVVITGDKEIVITKSKALHYIGKVAALISLICGCGALLFAVLPFAIGWFAPLFWLLYPLSIISLIFGIASYFMHKVWQPTIGILAGMCSIIIASCAGEYYILAMAGSVNKLTSIAKIFIDALEWPF